MLIEPEGKSLVAITSAKLNAGKGYFSFARMMHEFPDASTGRILEIIGRKLKVSGKIIPTIPVGSGIEKLKYPACTGFTVPDN
ncbi:unnamed protein product [Rotaria sp. Silwood1]|nr:unnamed protein product [Rotaria sp. Silwood1]CAF4863636.1 unnamed protein product [Rotaria sp. Silwood1]